MRFTDWSSDLCSSDLDVRQGLPAKLWLGAMDSSGSVIADPYLVFEGLTDVAEIEEGGETETISISAEKDRKSVVTGKSASERGDHGGRRNIKKTKRIITITLKSNTHKYINKKK